MIDNNQRRCEIDIKKYEGHTPAPWIVGYPNCESFPENAVFINGCETSDGDSPWSWSPFFNTTSSGKEISEELGIMLKFRSSGDGEFDGGNTPLADVLLMADAPLLLAEVKRLREGIESYLLRYEPAELVREDGVIIHELKELIE